MVNEYYISELKDPYFTKAVQSEDVQQILYEVADDRYVDGIRSIESFLTSVECKFDARAILSPEGAQFDIELTDRGEDMFNPEALEAYTGHMEDVPKANSDGYFIGYLCAERWNTEFAPDLQAKFDIVNSKVDRFVSMNTGLEEVEFLWDYDNSPVADDLYSLRQQYVDCVAEVVTQAVSDVKIDYWSALEDTEQQIDLLDSMEVKFDSQGVRVK